MKVRFINRNTGCLVAQTRLMRSLIVSVLCAAAPTLVGSETHKHSPELEGLNPQSTVDVIVQFKETPGPSHHQKVRNHGGSLRSELHLVRGAAYTIPASSIEALSTDPDVVYVSPDRTVKGSLDLTTQAVNANQVWQQFGLDGSGIGVAVIDSGIAAHDDLKERIVYSQSFLGDNDTHDKYGHGT